MKRWRRVAVSVFTVVATSAAAMAGPPALAQDESHEIDFQDDPIGEPPAEWSELWRESDFVVEDDPARLVHTAPTSGRQGLSPDVVGELEGDVEVAALVRSPATSGTQRVLYLHAGGEAGAENAYYVDFRGETGEAPRYRINRYEDGSFSTLQWGPDLDAAPVPTVWYQMVFQRRGNDLRFKVWPYGTEEPDEWMIETSDSTHQGGKVALGHSTGGDTVTEWAYVSVAEEGSAARAPEGIVPEPVVPDAPSVEDGTTSGQVSVAWDEVRGADWYEVERDGQLIASPWQLTAYADPLLSPDAQAPYRVRGVSAVRGPGEWSDAVSVTAPPVRFPEAPTPFEESGGELTSFEQEQEFLTELDARSDRVELEQSGTSVEGRPIQLARIGHPEAPDEDEVRQRSSLFVNCTVHGNEWTPRESCLGFIRDLALTDDPAVTDILAEHAVIVTPTANPDGQAADTRENAQGLDVNRDYLALESPEARAAVGVINQYQPAVVLDGHNCCADSIVPNWAQHPNVGSSIREQAQGVVEDALLDGGAATGYTGQRSTLATGGNATIARNYSGLRNTLGLLNEVRSGAIAGRLEEQADDPDAEANRRHRAVRAFDFVLDATLEHFSSHNGDITQAISRSTAAAQAGGGPTYVGEDTSDLVEPTPVGYRLTAQQHDQITELLELHEINVETDRDGVFVSMAQTNRRVIPLLLDPRAETSLVDAEPVEGDHRFSPTRETLADLLEDGRVTAAATQRVTLRLDRAEDMVSRSDNSRGARQVLESLVAQLEDTSDDDSDPDALAQLADEVRELIAALEP